MSQVRKKNEKLQYMIFGDTVKKLVKDSNKWILNHV